MPPNLRELVLDFTVLLDGGGNRCSDYRFKEVRPNNDGNGRSVDACGTPLAVRVSKGSCGNLLGSEFVSVSVAYVKGPTFYGNVPLVIEGVGFLPACSNLAS
ncbi:MAG: hypothetical protein EHM16_13220 [Betaproteobacteria bacterium]|nr:MAG: hypothetical protein EHM16_13220 [Betaproteobacteria bacterium]